KLGPVSGLHPARNTLGHHYVCADERDDTRTHPCFCSPKGHTGSAAQVTARPVSCRARSPLSVGAPHDTGSGETSTMRVHSVALCSAQRLPPLPHGQLLVTA